MVNLTLRTAALTFGLTVVLWSSMAFHSYASPPFSAFTTLYVSTGGNDANPGTRERPLASLDGARLAARKLLHSGVEDIIIYFEGGTYPLSRTVVFTPSDSPEKGRVVYSAIAGEKVVFTSDVAVDGWKKVAPGKEPEGLHPSAMNKLWVADLPAPLGCIKSLYFGERKLPRSRGKGFFPLGTASDLKKEGGPALNVLRFPEGAMRNWLNVEDIEIRIIPRHQFTMNLLPLLSVDETSRTAVTKIDGTYELIRGYFSDPGQKASAWVENAPDWLDVPGEWIVNTLERKIYYWPADGRQPGRISAPLLKEYIRFEGNEAAGALTKNIILRGFIFARGERDTWDDRTACVQHDYASYDRGDALVRYRFAAHCTLEYCDFINSGGTGVRCDLYAQDIVIKHNNFNNLGASAVILCGYGPGTKDVNSGNTVSDNYIHDIGQEYWQSSAILLYQSGNNLIARNFIHDTPYSGISLVGNRSMQFVPGKRSRETAPIRFHETGQIRTWPEIIPFLHGSDNVVEYNRITRIGKLLGDMNGIYISSTGRNNTVRYNYLYDVQYRMSNGGIRTDDQQHDTYIHHNVIDGCTGRGITMKGRNYCENNFIIDIPEPDDPRNLNKVPILGYLVLRRGPMEGSFIKGNILLHYGKAPVFIWTGQGFGSTTSLDNVKADSNLVFCAGYPARGVEYLNEARDLHNVEKHSLAADPLFRDAENHDYLFGKGSPAPALGIEPVDITETGPDGETGWKGLK